MPFYERIISRLRLAHDPTHILYSGPLVYVGNRTDWQTTHVLLAIRSAERTTRLCTGGGTLPGVMTQDHSPDG